MVVIDRAAIDAEQDVQLAWAVTMSFWPIWLLPPHRLARQPLFVHITPRCHGSQDLRETTGD